MEEGRVPLVGYPYGGNPLGKLVWLDGVMVGYPYRGTPLGKPVLLDGVKVGYPMGVPLLENWFCLMV